MRWSYDFFFNSVTFFFNSLNFFFFSSGSEKIILGIGFKVLWRDFFNVREKMTPSNQGFFFFLEKEPSNQGEKGGFQLAQLVKSLMVV